MTFPYDLEYDRDGIEVLYATTPATTTYYVGHFRDENGYKQEFKLTSEKLWKLIRAVHDGKGT